MSELRARPQLRTPIIAAGFAMLLAIPLSIPTVAAHPVSIATEPVSRLDTPWWRERFLQKQAELKAAPVDLLWLGDSITQNWERAGPEPWRDFAPAWKRFYGTRHAVNLGFRGDSTCHLLWRLEHGELDDIAPKAAILLIGANNFGHIHTDADQTFDGIVRILHLLHRRLPATKIILIGVLPSIRSAWVDSNTHRLNRRLAALPAIEGEWLDFVDAGPIFVRQGKVDPSAFLDPKLTPPDPPLHPTAASQTRIAEMIEPLLAGILHNQVH